jgi:hypothetical protein
LHWRIDAMKRLLVAAAACVAALAPLSAGAVTSQMAPLKVVSCVVGYLNSGNSNGLTNGVTITVMNASTKPIASFSGGGVYDTTTVTDTIAHPVAPGASYTFTKHYTPFVYYGSGANCFVSKVVFADGTSWAAQH